MRKFNLILFLLIFLCGTSWATPPTRSYNYIPNATIDPNQNNTNENSLYSYLQVGVDTYAPGSISAASINANASIAYSQLSLSNSIVNADINSSAAIVASKLDLTSPGAIGSTVPNTGAFTTLTGTLTGNVTGNLTGNVTGNLTGSVSNQLGAWSSVSNGSSIQATTDGFVIATDTNAGTTMTIKSDSANPPTTVRITAAVNTGTSCATIPVRKNDYYLTTNATTVFFISMGT